jgi:hypothetical protein
MKSKEGQLMNTGKLFGVLVLLVAVVAGYELLMAPVPRQPPNRRVCDATFDALTPGMTAKQVEALLGVPHTIGRGEVVRLQEADTTKIEYEIQTVSLTSGGDVLNIYEGQDHERIRVLLANVERRVLAVEYCVDELPVLYKGALSIKDKRVSPLSTPRTVPTDLAQGEGVQNIIRRRAMRAAADAKDPQAGPATVFTSTRTFGGGSAVPPPPPPPPPTGSPGSGATPRMP